MSQEQFSRGIDIIRTTASNLRLRAVFEHEDRFGRIARISFELLDPPDGVVRRAKEFDLGRSFVEDLPGTRDLRLALGHFLDSLSARLAVRGESGRRCEA